MNKKPIIVEKKLINNCLKIGSKEFIFPGRVAKLIFTTDSDPNLVRFPGAIYMTVSSREGVSFWQNLEWQDMETFFIGTKKIIKTLKVSIPIESEPSLIYKKLSLRKPSDTRTISPPGIYPFYASMNCEQRWQYLNWLQDPSKAVDISYVFTYYYGLERHLILGDIDAAADEVLSLRSMYKHPSFESYSREALISACILRNQQALLRKIIPEVLDDINNSKYLGNLTLLAFKFCKIGLTPRNVIKMAIEVFEYREYIKYREYIRKNSAIFEKCLEEIMIEKFRDKRPNILERYKIEDLPKAEDNCFANLSFPDELRKPQIPNFLKNPLFREEVQDLLKAAHERAKIIRRKRK